MELLFIVAAWAGLLAATNIAYRAATVISKRRRERKYKTELSIPGETTLGYKIEK